jgi:uncharacterized protein (TIGR03435 family)
MRTFELLLSAALFAARAGAQQPPASFEVASVKHAAPLTGGELSFRKDAQQASYRHLSMKVLLMQAWEVKIYQISGPKWLDEENYDIVAKLHQGAGQEVIPEVLQTLLQQRFGVQAHRETRVVPAYALVVDRGGAKLQPTKAVELPKDADGMTLPGAVQEALRKGQITRGMLYSTGRIAFGGQPIGRVATDLSGILDRPVIDMTVIQGEFDFVLYVSPDDVGSGPAALFLKGNIEADDTTVSVFTSLRKYGLKLEPRNLPIDYLVVDDAEKDPTEN